MRVAVLTSSTGVGAPSACIPALLATGVEVAMVIVSGHQVANPWRLRRRKLKKVTRIGLLGALNGIRMRSWYGEQTSRLLTELQPLHVLCADRQVRLERTPTINCPRTVELLRESRADLGLSLGNGYIGTRVFSTPRLGMVNSHGEILPEFQNAQSVIWQIYEGSTTTGYTIHQIDKHIDTGPILYQERLPIDFRPTLADTVAHTCAAITRACARGMTEVVTNYDALAAKARPQSGGRSRTTPTFAQFAWMMLQHRLLYRMTNRSSGDVERCSRGR